jgi:hypothetical protein
LRVPYLEISSSIRESSVTMSISERATNVRDERIDAGWPKP